MHWLQDRFSAEPALWQDRFSASCKTVSAQNSPFGKTVSAQGPLTRHITAFPFDSFSKTIADVLYTKMG